MAGLDGEREHVARVFASIEQKPSVGAGGVSTQQDVIAASWRRCVEGYGLEPHRLPAPTVLSYTELQEFRGPIEDLVTLARPELDRLFSRLRDHDYILLFTDTHGVAVDFRCEANLLDEARRTGLYLGSLWAENSQGTNGVGTCLHERNPLSIVMGDHFAIHNVRLTCTVAPIFASDGRLAAVLDVSTPRPTDHAVQSIVRKMVGNSARRIENYAFAHHRSRDIVVRLSRYEDFSDAASDVMLALDGDGRIVAAGTGAAALIATADMPLTGRRLDRILDCSLDAIMGTAAGTIRLQRNGGRPLFLRLDQGSSRPRHGRRPGARTAEANGRSPALGTAYDLEALAGADPTMLANVEIARRVFDRSLPILLTGETGTGKGLFGRALHAASRRGHAPFVVINCAAIPKELIESELFGYRPGAFTGASPEGFKGRIVEASGGTLFLDEIGDMPIALQTRLLQVLSDGEVTPIGATRPIPVDLALISATHHDLERRVRDGSFREDLYFRLNGATLALPPLRQRRDRADIIESVFVEEAHRGGARIRLTAAARTCLAAHLWPGNIRELRHAMRYLVALVEHGEIRPEHLPPFITQQLTANGQGAEENTIEKLRIAGALKRTAWNITAAARLLGISRSTLHRKMQQYALARGDG